MPKTIAGDNASVATTGTKKKRKNLIKIVAKGLSLKKKKKRPDDESVVGVELDGGGSVATAAGRAQPKSNQHISKNGDCAPSSAPSDGTESSTAKPIQVVLLLMDPASRRFELLQLEFDSNKAKVSDVLRQVKYSATEKTLRDMTYDGVCDQDGTEMIAVMKLSAFCKGNDVVIAIPNGMTGKDTAKLAGPILFDPKVEEMLPLNRAKVISKQERKMRLADTKLSKIPEDTRSKEDKRLSPGSAEPTKKKSSSNLPTVMLGLIISSILYLAAQHHVRVSRPLESGSILLRGEWKSQCGIFDLLPEKWLDRLPLDKMLPSCNSSSSSMLELGRDGTLRYFTKVNDGQRKEKWTVVCGAGDEGQCSGGKCLESGVSFVKDGYNWYVVMGRTRNALIPDVARDFFYEQ